MTPSDIKTLTIMKENGISQQIDAQLDEELSMDVTLSREEWGSVFDILKTDEAKEEIGQQYEGAGTNIYNKKDYKVEDGQEFKITQTAWQKILEIAQKAWG